MSSEVAHSNVGHNAMRIEIVKTMDQLVQVFAIRAICFMEDTGLPYDHAFDFNDLQSTHLLAYNGDEPVGSVRIRWFKDFAKLERTAFRPAYRNIPAIKVLADFAFAHIARKGYGQAITHASPLYARLWRTHFGFKQVRDKAPAMYHGGTEQYVELIKYLDVPPNAVTLDASVNTLLRIEGEWDVPGKYEEAG